MKHISKSVLFSFLTLTLLINRASGEELSRENVMATLELANSYFATKYPNVNIITGSAVMDFREFPSSYWAGSVYYAGLMALHSVDPKTEYLDQAVAWGESHQWKLNSYTVGSPQTYSRNANDHCAGQSYIDLYLIDPQPERIAVISSCLATIVDIPAANQDWDWIDAIFMAMPTFAKLGVIHNDDKYFDKMHQMYLATKNVIGGGLYNTEDGLWWRDADFAPPYVEPNGEDCYWSRGNGWVYAGLVRVLEVLPEDNQYRDEYIQTYIEMSQALLDVQRSDGFWNVSLHDPTHFGGKELTGTAMFTYGFAWGINNNILEKNTYYDPAINAWQGMSQECVHPDGSLGYVQGTGKEPSDSQPVTYDSRPDLEDYGLGCFLLAGSEVYKFEPAAPATTTTAAATTTTAAATTTTVAATTTTTTTAPAAQPDFVAYHDFGSHSGTPSTGNITTHQTTTDAAQSRTNPVDLTVKNLIRYSDGVDTGVDFSIAGSVGMDNRDGKVVPPAGGTAADTLFNVAGLNLTTGTIVQGGNGVNGMMTITLTGLDSSKLYDVAFYGNRNLAGDYQEQFILGGADSAINSSSAGVIDPLTTNVETRNIAGTAGDVIRWSDIDPGADGTITVTMDPDILDLGYDDEGELLYGNVGYLNAMRLEEQTGTVGTLIMFE